MRRIRENGPIFICDNCDAVLEGSYAANIHYNNCTAKKEGSETSTQEEDSLTLSPVQSAQSDEKELLIAEVFSREPLWNSQLPYVERSHNITSSLWQEIDNVLCVQNGYSQKTFKSLRDRYVKLLAEESKSKRSGSAASSKIDWKYFTQLNFLRPTVEFRSTISSLPKNKRSSFKDVEASERSCSSTPQKKNKGTPSVPTSLTEDFELFFKKHLETNTPDRIGSFMLYLESEMRTLSNQAAKKLIRKISESLMQVQDEYVT